MPTLLSPLSCAGLTFRNRIAMPPMWSGKATPEGFVTADIVEYHRVRAAAGCGLVIVEHAFVDPRGRHSRTQLGVHADSCLEGLSRLAAAIRGEGAVACIQISHAGARSSSAVTGERPLAPSVIRSRREASADLPEPATSEQLVAVAEAFGRAAGRARAAGFDAVEVHAAHGFLLSQFLSPLSNLRDDEYGGDEERRGRLHLEVLRAVRAHTERAYPIFVRLGAHDEWEGGLTLDPACRMAARLVDASACLIDVSGGLAGSDDPGRGPGYFVPYAERMRQAVAVPVLVAGGITDWRHADALVREGKTDLVGIGRAMLADPLWATHAIAELGG